MFRQKTYILLVVSSLSISTTALVAQTPPPVATSYEATANITSLGQGTNDCPADRIPVSVSGNGVDFDGPYTAYNQGNFSSGQNVTLLFVNADSMPNLIEQFSSVVVDQLDGDLYMQGNLTAHPYYVTVAPLAGSPPEVSLSANQAITLTLTGYCSAFPESVCPGVQ